MKDISNTFQAAPKVDVTTLSNMASLAVVSVKSWTQYKKLLLQPERSMTG